MGTQRRIFVYVSVGLVAISGLLAAIGIRGIRLATDEVFEARLGTAKSLTLILERDVLHVVAEVQRSGADLGQAKPGPELDQVAGKLLDHIAIDDTFSFFQPDGIIVMDSEGNHLGTTGMAFSVVLSQPSPPDAGSYRLVEPTTDGTGVRGLAVVDTSVGEGPDLRRIAVHLAARNSPQPFMPDDYLGSETNAVTPASARAEPSDFYDLEVIDPLGHIALSIGHHAARGLASPHKEILDDHSPISHPIILRHDVHSGTRGESHVMAVVPFSESDYLLSLEQPIDEALELPRRLTRQLVLLSALGLAVALIVAWVTTRAMVKPARQLTVAADRIGRGDFDTPVQVEARDEFELLANRFESMRQEIADAYKATEESNIVLESRVTERTKQLGHLLGRVISAQEDERRRIARELHDETAQTLGAISIALGRAHEAAAGGPRTVVDQLSLARTMVAALIEEARRLILDLRPMILDDLGLTPAIRWLVESRLEGAGIKTQLTVEASTQRLAPAIETTLFRIVQEAANNIVRHAEASQASVEFTIRQDSIHIIVADDGIGFDVPGAEGIADGHLGLAGMNERVGLLGGEMSIVSVPGTGTTVTIEIPIAGTELWPTI